MAKSSKADAERLERSIEHADLYDAGVGEWMPPERRALNDFIEIVQEEYYSNFDQFLTRYSTPNKLPGGNEALRTVFKEYSVEVCADFADLLLDTYYGASMSEVEQAVLGHVAAECPAVETRERAQTEHHAMDHMEPIAVIDGDAWEATLRFEATGEYITVSGTAERTQEKVKFETKSNLGLSFSSPRVGRVHARRLPDELRSRDRGDVATVVAFRVVDEDAYSAATRVGRAFDAVTRAVDLDHRQADDKLGRTFRKIARGKPVNESTFSSGDRFELNDAELVKVARRIEAWVEMDTLPPLVERYANRELE